MDLKKTIKEINKGREKAEAAFVFCVWKNPEFYSEYTQVNKGKDKTLKREDSIFFWQMGRKMYESGIRTFDALSIDMFLDGKDKAREIFESYGGQIEINNLMSLAETDNVSAYFDVIARMNALETWATKTDELFEDVHNFDNVTSEEVYEVFEQINNEISLRTNHKEKMEDLVVDDKFIDKLESGENVGFNYGKYCPQMNYITLGAAPGSLFMIGGMSGTGKTSFTFENMLMSMHYQKDVGKIAIISNEMKRDTYRILLLLHVLTKDMKYYGLTQKQLKKGQFNKEQKEKIAEAQKIIQEEYADNLIFIKTFDNDISKIMKYMKHLKSQGVSICLFDTFKADDELLNKSIWETLLIDSRRLFQLCSKLDICLITTYQLALHKQNIRYLDATCLSNGKQIKEVYETLIYLRPVWDDERDPNSKYYIHPWRFKRDKNYQYVTDENGKWIKEEITLEPDDKYVLFFIDKTRADEDKQILLYRWRARFNEWREEGYAKVINTHQYT